jgi:Domain of unknown function (DUF4337)
VSEIEVPNPEELEERRDKAFSRRVALTTAVYAVLLAIASLGGNYAMKEMLLAQQEATNQWAYYQAKVVREHLNRGNKVLVQTQVAEPSGLTAGERSKYDALARRFADEEQRMATDKKEIETEARKHEETRDRYRKKDPYFDFAEVMLQIAIVTASVSILATSRSMFRFSMALAVVGALLTANGFFLLVDVPLLH